MASRRPTTNPNTNPDPNWLHEGLDPIPVERFGAAAEGRVRREERAGGDWSQGRGCLREEIDTDRCDLERRCNASPQRCTLTRTRTTLDAPRYRHHQTPTVATSTLWYSSGFT